MSALDIGTLAHAALKSLAAFKRHEAECQQCRYSPRFCTERPRFEHNFTSDYGRWAESYAATDEGRLEQIQESVRR